MRENHRRIYSEKEKYKGLDKVYYRRMLSTKGIMKIEPQMARKVSLLI